MLRSCACLIWFWREGRHPEDSSEPAVNFLGRREFMAKTRWRQLSLVPELLGGILTRATALQTLRFISRQSKVRRRHVMWLSRLTVGDPHLYREVV